MRAPAIQISGEKIKKQKTQKAQKTKYGDVHGNRKEASVAGAKSAGEKAEGNEVREEAKGEIVAYRPLKDI